MFVETNYGIVFIWFSQVLVAMNVQRYVSDWVAVVGAAFPKTGTCGVQHMESVAR